MAEFSAGTVYVQVLPSLDDWKDRIDEQLKDQLGKLKAEVTIVPKVDTKELDKQLANTKAKLTPEVETDSRQVDKEAKKAAGAFADAFRARVAAALKSLPELEISANSSRADRTIANVRDSLVELGKQTVGVDLDDTVALNRLTRLRDQLAQVDGDDVTIQAHFDATKAIAELESFRKAVEEAGKRDGGAFADAFTAKVKAAIKALPEVKLDANSSELDTEIAKVRKELIELSDKRLDVDITTERALADLDALRTRLAALDRSDVDIRARFDANAAIADIDKFRATIAASGKDAEDTLKLIRRELSSLSGRKVTIDLDEDEANAKLDELKAKLDSISGATASITVRAETAKALADLAAVKTAMFDVDAEEVDVEVDDHGSIDLLSTRMQRLIALCVAGSGAIGGAAVAAVALAAGAVAGAAGVAALAIGGAQVVAAMKAQTAASQQLGQTEKQEAQQRLSAANQVLTAQESLASASRGVAEAQRNAANSVRSALDGQTRAEERLTAAQTASLRAQQALTDAKLNAQRSIEDLKNKAIDDALDQREAVIKLEDAQKGLNETLADPTATERQRIEAQLAFDQRKQQLDEISLSLQRSTVDSEAATKAGVNGSREVITAQDSLISSQQAYRDAQRATVDAERQVTEARLDGAHAVSQAQLQVIQAQRQLVQAQGAVAVQASAAGAAQEKFRDALEKLSPQALNLITYLRSQSGEWRLLSQAAQQFAPGLQSGMQRLEPFFDSINQNVGILSRSTGSFFDVIGQGLSTSEPFFDSLAVSSQTLFPRFGETVNTAARSVGSLVVQMLPLAPAALDSVDALSELVSVWAPFIAQASGPLLQSFQGIIQNLDFLGPLLVAVAEPAGDLTETLTGGLREAFAALTPELGPLLTALVDTVEVITPLIGSSGELAGMVANLLVPAVELANNVLEPMVSLISGLVHLFAEMPVPLQAVVVGFLAFKLAAEPLQRMLTGIATGLQSIATKSVPMLTGLGFGTAGATRFGSAVSKTGTALSKMGTAIPFVGAAIIGIGEAFAAADERAQKAAEGIDRMGLALIRGGTAGDSAAAQLEIWRRATGDMFTESTAGARLFAEEMHRVAGEVEASTTRQRNSMSNVQIAQEQVNQAQLDYDRAVRDIGPNSAVAAEAHGRLAVAVTGLKNAQHDASEATKTTTQRLQDQQDQILAMTDARVAKDRAGLQLQRAQGRVSDSVSRRDKAAADAKAAQDALNAAIRAHGKGSVEAQQAQLDYTSALGDAADAELDIKEAQLDLTSAQSNYVATSKQAAVASAEAAGAFDTEQAATRGQNDALIELLRTQGEALPPSILSMIAGMSDADKAFYGLTTTVDATGRTMLSLPGAPGQPPLSITFQDNIDHIQARVVGFKGFLDQFWFELTGMHMGESQAGAVGSVVFPAPGRSGLERFVPSSSFQGATPVVPRLPAKRAGGGPVGGSGFTDTVPALLTPGEFVFSRPAVQRIGSSNLASVHAAARRGYRLGGLVTPARFAEGGTVGATGETSAPPVAWLSALVDTFDEITTSLAPLSAGLQDKLSPALETTLDSSSSLAEGTYGDWTSINTVVSSTVASLTGTMLPALIAALSQVDIAMQRTATTFAAQWSAMQGYAANPVRWTLQYPFNQGLVAAWNAIDSMFAVGKPLAPIPIPFAGGGSVTGGQAGRDSVLAALMPGEFVVPVPMVNQIGMGNLEAARRAVLRGGSVEGLIPGYEAGGAVSKALAFATAQVGKPYIWGAVGPNGYDCSGFMSAIANVAMGLSPYSRRFTTSDFAPGVGAGGFLPGTGSSFVIGVSGSHMGGTLAGHNVESTTKNGVSGPRVDGDASGALDPQFTKGQFYLPAIGGQFVPGPTGGKPFDWASMLAEQFIGVRDATASIVPLFGGSRIAAGATAEMNQMIDAVIGWATAHVASAATGGAAGSGPVVDQVRAVAARFGWGSGPQWDALSTLIGHESSWNPTAQNPTSTAFGLFQFLDSTWGSFAKTSNPTLQAEAGMPYIQRRYGDPIGAWQFWQGHHWYDDGGYLPPGLSLAYNGTGHPEPVLTSQQWSAVGAGSGDFTGVLYLDSGELLGVVRGEIAAASDATGRNIAHRTRV